MFCVIEISNVRWVARPFRPSDALSVDRDSLGPSVQGIPIQLSRSILLMVPSLGSKLDNVLSPVV